MRTLQIELPEVLEMNDRQVRTALAAKLYEMGRLSLGQAAELSGYSKSTFMELLADYGVSYFQMSPEDVEKDYQNAKRHSKRQQLPDSSRQTG